MLARAICQDTDVLILDEPTSFLDVQFKLDILSIIKRLAKEKNKSVIMSIHELEYVPAVADVVVAIASNKVYKIGSPEDVLTGDNLEVTKCICKKVGIETLIPSTLSLNTGMILSEGLWEYAKAIEKMLCQK